MIDNLNMDTSPYRSDCEDHVTAQERTIDFSDTTPQNAELMAECEDLELQRGPAPEGSENGSPERRQ
jgi:hypothetical protein